MHAVTEEFLLRKVGFALLAAEEQPFLTTRHRHTTAEQMLQAGSVMPILLLLKGLWNENFAIALTTMHVIMALIIFQFGTVARFLFTNHQIWYIVIYDFAQVCIFFNQTSHCYFQVYNKNILSVNMVCMPTYIPVKQTQDGRKTKQRKVEERE